MELNEITSNIIGAAMKVHRALGPGLLDSAYEARMMFELGERQLKVERQKPIALVYRDVKLECGYRLDLLVEDQVVVEIKAIDLVLPVHRPSYFPTCASQTAGSACRSISTSKSSRTASTA